MVTGLDDKGWLHFPADPGILRWSQAALEAAETALNDPALAHWYQCENTWFVGVDALPNDANGTLNGTPLQGAIINALGPMPPLHRAQLSVIWPGYPKPRADETDAAFRYRQTRDAAHVDGITGTGTPKRRTLTEPHAWILGLPLDDAPATAAPLTIWEGSHHILGAAFRKALQHHAPAGWPQIDITDIYTRARKEVFDTCPRITLPAKPGEATLLHRHTLHGVAPWHAREHSRRAIAYFRPELPNHADWL